MEISVHTQIMNLSKVFTKKSKMLMLETNFILCKCYFYYS